MRKKPPAKPKRRPRPKPAPRRHFEFRIPRGYRVVGFDKLEDYVTE